MEVQDITKEAVVVSEATTLEEALTKMVREHTNTLLVIDTEGRLSGEVSVSDFLDAVVPDTLDGDSVTTHFSDEAAFEKAVRSAADTSVGDFMSRDFDAIRLSDNLMTVAATAIAHQRARIPVVDADDRPVGIISRQGLKHILAKYLSID